MNDLLEATDEGKVSILTLLDLSAAFDTIDHAILLKRLSITFGMRGTVLKWFQSYLVGRTFFMHLDGINSAQYDLEFGVPQGFVLGPILYTMYTQPLGKIINTFDMIYHM